MKKQRADGSTWEYYRRTYRCSSFVIPKSGQPKCFQKVFQAERLEKLVVDDIVNFVSKAEAENLMNSYIGGIRVELSELQANLRKANTEIIIKEKEIQKIKEILQRLL